jgi:hypothetical protein
MMKGIKRYPDEKNIWLFGNSRGEHPDFAVTRSRDHQERDSTTRIPKEPNICRFQSVNDCLLKGVE